MAKETQTALSWLLNAGGLLERRVAGKRAAYLAMAILSLKGSLFAAADAVVAPDGSGDYTSVQEAISRAPMRTGRDDPRWVIQVKPGTYRERIHVQRERGNILVRGEDAANTVIVFDQHANIPGPDGKIIGTFRTPTVWIDADGMIWENLTLANDAGRPGPRPEGPPVAQALALRVDGDKVVFRGCRFLGWQDTVLTTRGRQYFVDCYIEGNVDFIFGGGTAYFERCHIHCLANGYITAASTPDGERHGMVFADCRITGEEGVRTYLGRPWREFAKTVFIRTEMTDVVRPEGWHNWNKPDAEKTTFYREFGNTGPGSNPAGRPKWTRILGTGEVARYTPATVLAGSDGWNPAQAPTVHFVGDSTMADKGDSSYPERGWGQMFRAHLAPGWRLVNHAANGRSTVSIRTLGHWEAMMAQLNAGDWVVIQFSHNDEKKEDPTRYADPEVAFPANLRAMVAEVRTHGAHPVLATPVVRRHWTDTGQLLNTHGAYVDAVRKAAAAEGAPLIDMEAISRRIVTDLGPDASKGLYTMLSPGEHPSAPEGRVDNTHFSRDGGARMAAAAAAELLRLGAPFVSQ